ncbi:MAG: SMI1/KNR4 family protein [Acidobacteria bacterium]|nr:SMI1/KNR4 family protein [Acidobacteriota bacterium]
MLSLKNGFYAFESALHVFPYKSAEGFMDITLWNASSTWKAFYKDDNLPFFFAEDVFGFQFGVKDGEVVSFDPETGESTFFSKSIESWAEKILNDYNLHTGYKLAHDWQLLNGHLSEGKRLVPIQPFVLGGAFDLANLKGQYAVDAMRFRASLANQIKGLEDGTTVKLKVS